MARYYFHVREGTVALDTVGAEFVDDDTARQEAARTAGELLANRAATFHEDWTMWVTDDPHGRGRVVVTAHFRMTID